MMMAIQFNTMSEFLAMGGHGVYVWSCYGLILFCVLVGVAMTRQARKKILQEVRRHQLRENQYHNKAKAKAMKKAINKDGI